MDPWFVIDREGDNRNILHALNGMANAFTIRGTKNRCLTSREEERHVRESVARQPVLATDSVTLSARGEHIARVATVTIRAKQVELRLRRHPSEPSSPLKLYAVVVRGTSGDGRHDNALGWLLYTNAPVTTE